MVPMVSGLEKADNDLMRGGRLGLKVVGFPDRIGAGGDAVRGGEGEAASLPRQRGPGAVSVG